MLLGVAVMVPDGSESLFASDPSIAIESLGSAQLISADRVAPPVEPFEVRFAREVELPIAIGIIPNTVKTTINGHCAALSMNDGTVNNIRNIVDGFHYISI